MKKCSMCFTIKPVTQFNINAKNKDGFHNYCKACASSYYKGYNASRTASNQSVWVDSKVCRHCHLKKPISQFGLKNNNPDKHNIYCKPCNREMSYASVRRTRNGK